MAITASGVYALTMEKMFIGTAGQSLEAETHRMMLVQDGYTPNFSSHDFRNDVTNEVSGIGYTTGGTTITTTEVVIGSPVSGSMMWDHADVSWPTSTIVDAMAAIDYFNVGANTTDMLIALMDFVTAVTTNAGLLLVTIASGGVFNLDFTP